ncbi:MAG: excinuclease ABC subunit UvrC [Actinobacteria bacterium]|nr:excinuclease ABC subunit UvrC [Actinomycetota bacterium]
MTFRPEPGTVPAEPGCYLWRDRHDRVIYVGKAKSLRSRLASYFGAWSGIAQRTRAMLEAAARVEWIVCDNEVEALHLEYNLIKRHRPRYNVRYTDDKSYPYLAVTVQDDVPRAMVRRNPRKDGTRYFGPYAHAYAIRETLDLLLRVFPVRTCSQAVFDRCRRNDRPCLLHHIGRCSAPCVGNVSHAEHRELVEALIGFLSGHTDEVLAELSERMASEAGKLNFEAAARLRDQLVAARRVLERQAMATGRREDFDAVHFHADELEAAFQAFFVRNGRVVGRKGWTVDRVEDLDTPALVGRFLLQLAMERAQDVPREVLVPVEPDDREALEELLTGLRRDARGDPRSGRVAVRVPQRGDKRAFLDTVRENAVEAFHQHRLKRAKDFNARSQALHELQDALGLAEAPLRIECYDISTLQGTDSVASMVVMEDGLPRKSEYRRFRIRGVEGQDDFAMMQEVITRRFRRLLDEAAPPTVDDEGTARKFAYPPSLVVIDGGKGQLNAARRALEALGVRGVAVCALAKRLEEVFLPDREEAVVLPRASEALYLVQRIRDEAHRFAVTYHRSLRGRRMTGSAFDDVPGIGPTRRAALLAHFGSVKRVREASPDQLARVEGISQGLATRLYERLHRPAAAR